MEVLGGRYRIDELAGSGGFGSVYRGYDERLDRPVAVKVTESMGKAEADILRRLDCDRMPELYDIITEHGKTFIVMEWIEGITLEKLIEEKGCLTETRTVKIGEELLDILEYLHGMSPAIIYQDLKPANIMITPDGRVCLVDLGTAFIRDYSDRKERTAGTVGYGAPEQRGLTGVSHADECSDIYAWGAVMYSCMSGRLLNRPPYTMERIRTVSPQISYGLAGVISKATRRDKKDRYGNVREVRKALDRCGLTDIMYRLAYGMAAAVFILPFVYSIYRFYSGGMAAELREAARNMYVLIKEGVKIKKLMGELWTAAMADRNEGYLRTGGLMLASGACMVFGIGRLRPHRFIRVKRSVYLSERKYPGLWIGGLTAGVIFGLGMGNLVLPNVSLDAEAAETGEVLPLSIEGEKGEKILVRYGSTFSPEGDLGMVIDREALDRYSAGTVTVNLYDSEGNLAAGRTIELERKDIQ